MNTKAQNLIKENLQRIEARIAAAAARGGRVRSDVRLVAVTKAVDAGAVRTLYESGVTAFGENRLPGVEEKQAATPSGAEWHMVGVVQRRKARDVAALFDWADAVDRMALAEALDKHCGALEKRLNILIEVNVSGEASKHGFAPEDLPEAVERIKALEHLRVRGLMTMAPYTEDPELTRPVFRRLVGLAEGLSLPELSMGMTNDFEVAIEEGATQVRIGSALFEGV